MTCRGGLFRGNVSCWGADERQHAGVTSGNRRKGRQAEEDLGKRAEEETVPGAWNLLMSPRSRANPFVALYFHFCVLCLLFCYLIGSYTEYKIFTIISPVSISLRGRQCVGRWG